MSTQPTFLRFTNGLCRNLFGDDEIGQFVETANSKKLYKGVELHARELQNFKNSSFRDPLVLALRWARRPVPSFADDVLNSQAVITAWEGVSTLQSIVAGGWTMNKAGVVEYRKIEDAIVDMEQDMGILPSHKCKLRTFNAMMEQLEEILSTASTAFKVPGKNPDLVEFLKLRSLAQKIQWYRQHYHLGYVLLRWIFHDCVSKKNKRNKADVWHELWLQVFGGCNHRRDYVQGLFDLILLFPNRRAVTVDKLADVNELFKNPRTLLTEVEKKTVKFCRLTAADAIKKEIKEALKEEQSRYNSVRANGKRSARARKQLDVVDEINRNDDNFCIIKMKISTIVSKFTDGIKGPGLKTKKDRKRALFVPTVHVNIEHVYKIDLVKLEGLLPLLKLPSLKPPPPQQPSKRAPQPAPSIPQPETAGDSEPSQQPSKWAPQPPSIPQPETAGDSEPFPIIDDLLGDNLDSWSDDEDRFNKDEELLKTNSEDPSDNVDEDELSKDDADNDADNDEDKLNEDKLNKDTDETTDDEEWTAPPKKKCKTSAVPPKKKHNTSAIPKKKKSKSTKKSQDPVVQQDQAIVQQDPAATQEGGVIVVETPVDPYETKPEKRWSGVTIADRADYYRFQPRLVIDMVSTAITMWCAAREFYIAGNLKEWMHGFMVDTPTDKPKAPQDPREDSKASTNISDLVLVHDPSGPAELHVFRPVAADCNQQSLFDSHFDGIRIDWSILIPFLLTFGIKDGVRDNNGRRLEFGNAGQHNEQDAKGNWRPAALVGHHTLRDHPHSVILRLMLGQIYHQMRTAVEDWASRRSMSLPFGHARRRLEYASKISEFLEVSIGGFEWLTVQLKCLSRGDSTKFHEDRKNCAWSAYDLTLALCYIVVDGFGCVWSIKFLANSRAR
jgi:hypothetical protein